MATSRFRDEFWRADRDKALRFAALRAYLRSLGFRERIRGSHHMSSRPGIPELLNLQPQGSRCKVYQVRQVRAVLVRHGLR